MNNTLLTSTVFISVARVTAQTFFAIVMGVCEDTRSAVQYIMAGLTFNPAIVQGNFLSGLSAQSVLLPRLYGRNGYSVRMTGVLVEPGRPDI